MEIEYMIKSMMCRLAPRSLMLLVLLCLGIAPARAAQPQVGQTAPDFSLQSLDGKKVTLRDFASRDRVVLIVLRGWPGYQCPLCQQQVHDLVINASKIDATKTKMLFVYPGPSEALQAHAQEFLKDKQWPTNWTFLIDPNYSMVNAYGLRWDAPKETAYPATFILEPGGKIAFSKISNDHGNRVKAKELLKELGSAE
jgi:peroxiredoxin